MKWASNFEFGTLFYFIAYFFLVLFLFVYALIWQQVIKFFDLSKAYSQRGIIIIWTLLWSVIFFDEIIKWNNILGTIIIIIGIFVVNSNE